MHRQFRQLALLGTLVGLGIGAAACDTVLSPDRPSTSRLDSSSGMRGDECRGTVGAVTVEKVIVPSGASCSLLGTRVQSDVEVKGNASLRAEGARVGGNIKAAGSNQIVVLNSYVNGNIQADNTVSVAVGEESFVGGNVQLKQGGSITVENTTADGDIQLEQNARQIHAATNRVGGNFQVFKNTGGVDLVGNRIAENLQCKENRPAPTGGGNIAGNKEDQCARL